MSIMGAAIRHQGCYPDDRMNIWLGLLVIAIIFVGGTFTLIWIYWLVDREGKKPPHPAARRLSGGAVLSGVGARRRRSAAPAPGWRRECAARR